MSIEFYRADHRTIAEVVHLAGQVNSEWLIPDLQRPFVWGPDRVIALLDSLLRGWPFGTLLVLNTGSLVLDGNGGSDEGRIPSEAFRQTVDRTVFGDTKEGRVPHRSGRADFRLVLDGQQRVQSLVLALAADQYGFKLWDEGWYEAIPHLGSQRPPRGANRAWSRGFLHLDLGEFERSLAENGSPAAVDFETALRWYADGDGDFGRHGTVGPKYRHAIPARFGSASVSITKAPASVRLSRLWELAVAPNTSDEWDAHGASIARLCQEQVPEGGVSERCKTGLAKLVVRLRAISRTDVHYLEISAPSPLLGDSDAYDDAIVQVFARLNTAGRALTRQEITFAWLKRKWPHERVGGRKASECFDELHELLKLRGVDLEIDQLVALTAAASSVLDGDGTPLERRELTNSSRLGALANCLGNRWCHSNPAEDLGLPHRLVAVASALQQRGLAWGDQVRSLNAWIAYTCWMLVLDEWRICHDPPLTAVNVRAVEEAQRSAYAQTADRWFFCNLWAGTFARDTSDALAAYTNGLAKLRVAIRTSETVGEASGLWRCWMDEQLTALATGAENGALRRRVTSRNQVAAYSSLLWIWNRLEKARFKCSAVTMSRTIHAARGEHVDHAIPWSWFDKHAPEFPTPDGDTLDAAYVGNSIGNMLLLKSDLNLAKSAYTLSSFLTECDAALVAADVQRDEWIAELQVPSQLLDANLSDLDSLRAAIDERTESIVSDLVAFCRGEKLRQDVI